MGVVNTKSTLVSNCDAQPRVLSSGYQAGGNDTISIATVAAAAGDSIASTYRFGFIRSGVRVQDIQIVNDATTAGVFQLGVYCNTQQGGVFTTGGVPAVAAAGAVPVANANLIFGTGISTAAAQATMKSVYSPTILTAAYTAANNVLRVWELLGLSIDPYYEFHLVATLTTAITAAGNITLQWSTVN